jgi:hypothetical protein
MNTSQSQILIDLFKNNHAIIHLQVEGITQDESLLQLPFRGNCMNWVIGHILGIRGECLETLDLPGTMDKAELKVYGYGSDPLTGCENAQDLKVMMKNLDDSLEIIIKTLVNLSPSELVQPKQIWVGKVSLFEALSFMQWHESYHTGQLEILRQLAGKNDKVI